MTSCICITSLDIAQIFMSLAAASYFPHNFPNVPSILSAKPLPVQRSTLNNELFCKQKSTPSDNLSFRSNKQQQPLKFHDTDFLPQPPSKQRQSLALPFQSRSPTLSSLHTSNHPFPPTHNNSFKHPIMASLLLSLPSIPLSILLNNYSASSLNLLFFYLTWSTLVLSHPPLRVEILTTLAIRLVFFIIPGILFSTFNYTFPSLAIKEQGSSESKYNLRSPRKKPPGFSATKGRGGFVRVLGTTLLNTLVGAAVQSIVSLLLSGIMKSNRRALSVTTALPLPWDAAVGVLLASLLREILIYYPHRRLHRSSAKPYAAVPVTIDHSDPPPSSSYSCLSRTSVGVGDYLILQFLPTYVPAVVLRMHVLTYLLFLLVVSVSETVAYSGYEVLPGFFWMGWMGRNVRGHAEGKGRGGYGWLGVLDWVHGTRVGDSSGSGIVSRGGRGRRKA